MKTYFDVGTMVLYSLPVESVYAGEFRPAIITRVHDKEGTVALNIFSAYSDDIPDMPTEPVFAKHSVGLDPEGKPGMWKPLLDLQWLNRHCCPGYVEWEESEIEKLAV
jgi:hypothetical protein